MSERPPVLLGDTKPAVADIAAIARGRVPVELTAGMERRLEAARAVVEQQLAANVPVYGLTTGLGAGVDTRLGLADVTAFQQRVPQARAVSVGAPVPVETVRAIMAARLSGFAGGASGISPGVAVTLVQALNAGVHPVVHSLGSIGEADLAQMSDVTRGLMGHGEAEFGGEILPAADALSRAGVTPLVLGPRDGHAMVSANAFSIALACLALDDLDRLIDWSFSGTALAFEAFRAATGVLDPRVLSLRPAFGQEEAGARLMQLFAGSALLHEGAARRLQDPLSYRCAPQIWGALLHGREEAAEATGIELCGPGDNPVVLIEEGLLVHNGNFDTTALALSWERLGMAMVQCASAVTHRCMQIMSPGISDLPRFLSPMGSSRNGFATVQKTLAALEAEIRHLATPMAFPPIPVADGIEDHASLAPGVLAKTATIIDRFRLLVAIEMIVSAQAVELRGVAHTLGAGTARAYAWVRNCVPPLTEDRAQGADFSAMAELLREESPATTLLVTD
ncbi:HAL/PAL/TAL family ammonia-lyase [Chachezhania antarctica]|uniref:HAL/PAL/TAL family ammonia-lyase n=1 Tax=Chachezhania antarctica TaxID=2340860 RepID=UPI00196983CB|nr:aromatic amino acid lyase [Chachezhania antarctica]